MKVSTLLRSVTRVSTLATITPASTAFVTEGCSASGSVGMSTRPSGFCARTWSTTGICVAGEYSLGSPCQMSSAPSLVASSWAPTFMAWKNGSDSAPMTKAIFLPAHAPAAAESPSAGLDELEQPARRREAAPTVTITPAAPLLEEFIPNIVEVPSDYSRRPPGCEMSCRQTRPDNVVR
ncbi:unannotated protein [freshwater metagenome]|uniref:Unannotated protein n=1 Tax=freshwater metagenome TaxID=449393 RepID=A0A6J7SIU6_9ZZZZ